jgi:amino acid adenylation domain-containing protein
MQFGMLFHYLSDNHSGEYVQQVVIDLNERVDIAALQTAVNQVARHHEPFQIGFQWESDDEPHQTLHRISDIKVHEYDWSLLAAAEQERQLRGYLETDRSAGFDLASPPLSRFALFRFGPDRYKLIWTYHHIILDGRSRYKVTQDFFNAYDAIRQGRPYAPEPGVSYMDYLLWLRTLDHSSGVAYWRKLLSGVGPSRPLALSDPAQVAIAPTAGVGMHHFRLDAATTGKLRFVARNTNVSLGHVAQAAWAILLARSTQEEKVVFGTVRDCRRSAFKGVENLVGLVMNTLPITADVTDETRLTDLLKEIRKQQKEQLPYNLTPLNLIQQQSGFPPDSRIFESYVVYDFSETITALRAKDPRWQNRNYQLIEKSNFPLHLSVFSEDELLVRCYFHPDQIREAAAAEICRRYESLLKDFSEPEDRPVWSYRVLPKEDEHLIVRDWNATQKPYDLDQTLMTMFERQVARTPHETALVVGDAEYSYQELNERANRMARFLLRAGVGPETLVGIFLERSLEMIVGLYGVLKAGGAYVPLDPEYPPERLEFMVEDTRVGVVVAQKRLKARLPKTNARVIIIDAEWEEIAKEDGSNFDNGAGSRNGAYVIFTSGSTGKPKGVVNEHRGIVNRLIWMQEEYPLSRDDRVLQKTPFSFDVSVWEFFWPLQVGAKLVVAKPGGHKDSAYLVDLIRTAGITTLHFVPSMLQMFLEEKDVNGCDSIKRVICSGEALTVELQRRFFEKFRHAELHNLYGPTEAAVDVTYWACRRESDLSIVPIGRPVANTRIYILDRHMQPVPVGVRGELYIGGVQVARGYLNRTELTELRFVRDPFGGSADAKLYRTGDLARYLSDGAIEYLGRVDSQVKIRGMRVELGEIEARIEEHERVGQCAVVLREDTPGDQRLAAYYTERAGCEVNHADLRTWLHEKLPDYMVPHHFVNVEKLPLTASGKVDRRSLPKPELKPSSGHHYVAPRSRTESLIAGVWKDLLGVEGVGLKDNFFDLGGHSLLVIRMAGRLKRHFVKPFGVMDIFERPTVERLAAFFAGEADNDGSPNRSKALDRGRKQREALQKMWQHGGKGKARGRTV